MAGEIPYMIVWGFFSALGWMTANWVVDKNSPDKEKDKPVIEKQVEDRDGRDTKVPKQKKQEQ
jgi:hypothetical protein